jgi:octaprenyl-diphosphate synthase
LTRQRGPASFAAMTPSSLPPRASQSFADAAGRLAPQLALVERAMHEQLGSASELIPRIGEHVFESGGKRMRPMLLLLAAEMCGYRGPRVIQISAAIELLHTATLLHDDVVDVSSLRRGRPSANALWGNRRAVLGGDFFYARASSMIVEDGNIDILRAFANAIRRMSEGELLQLERSFDATITESVYYSIIDHKSAVLLATATESGAILADVTRAEHRKLADFGRELGLAFQLRDDALDYEPREDDLGKRPYTDILEGKVTMPLLLALKRCDNAEREMVARFLKSAAHRSELEQDGAVDDLEVEPVVDLIQRHHGVRDTVRRARQHVETACAAIAAFPDGEAKQDLLAAAEHCAARDR